MVGHVKNAIGLTILQVSATKVDNQRVVKDHKPRKECNGSSWKGAGANGSVGSRSGAAKKVYNVNLGQPGFRRESEVGLDKIQRKHSSTFAAWMRNNRAAGEETSTPENQE